MRDEAAARRYASALTELAVAEGVEEPVLADLTALLTLLEGEGRELGAVLRAPIFSASERIAALRAVAEPSGLHKLVLRFAEVLVERERIADLPAITRHVTAALDARAGRVRVRIDTATPLDDSLISDIRAAFHVSLGKDVVITTTLDPSLIGGLVARVGSRVYDASLRTRLAEIRHRLIHAQEAAEA